jgi:hypothetical protein
MGCARTNERGGRYFLLTISTILGKKVQKTLPITKSARTFATPTKKVGFGICLRESE